MKLSKLKYFVMVRTALGIKIVLLTKYFCLHCSFSPDPGESGQAG